MTKDKNQLTKNDGQWYYEMPEPGFNYRITDFQSALGSSQLKKLDDFVKRRIEIATQYNDLFSHLELISTPIVDNKVSHAYHLYPLLIDFQKLKINKKTLFDKLLKNKISLQVHYIPVHLQPYYQTNFGFKYGDFPVAEDYYFREISLPIYPKLLDDEVSFVAKKIIDIINI